MVEHLQADRPIEMSVILAAHFADRSFVVLGQKSGRLLVESGAVVLAQLDPSVRVMNTDRNIVSASPAVSEDRERPRKLKRTTLNLVRTQALIFRRLRALCSG